jgi:hypothetical protein
MRILIICALGVGCCVAAILTAAAFVTAQWGFFGLNLASTIGAGAVCVSLIRHPLR